MKRIVALVFFLLVSLAWAIGLFYVSQLPTTVLESTLPVYLAISYVALASITVVAAFLLLLILFWRAVNLLLTFIQNIGVDSRIILLLSLGVACWLVPNGISSLANVFYSLLLFPFRLAEEATSSLTNAWQLNSNLFASNVPPSNSIAQVGMGFLSAWASSLTRTYSDNNYLFTGWYYIAMFFAAFALGAIVLRIAFLPVEAGDRTPALLTAFQTMPYARRQNLLFFALLLVAGYLSIAAVAAIPGLQETATTSADTSAETLAKSLEASLNAPSAQPTPAASSFGQPSPPPDPLESLRPKLKDSAASLAAKSNSPVVAEAVAAKNLQSLNLYATQQLELILSARDKLKRARSGLAIVIASAKQQAKTDAIRTYTVANLNRKGSRETNQHYLLIVQWFEQRVALLDDQLTSCDGRGDALDSAATNWTQDVQNWLNVSPTDLGPNTFNSISGPYQAVRFNPDMLYSADRACHLVTSDLPPVPDRPALGADLGPFRFVASWLMRMESMPLALIVGLLGFGLLGSACSTFVRERRAAAQIQQNQPPPSGSQPDRPLVSDLAGVLIRGLSAAVVVFLAVEGGLAVFSNPNALPNPYVLLLTCLVGAVYSETVWEWAERNLNKGFAQNQTNKNRDSEPPKPDQQPVPPKP